MTTVKPPGPFGARRWVGLFSPRAIAFFLAMTALACTPPAERFAAVQASSSLRHPAHRYAASNLIDGRLETTWCEGAPGPGIGSTLTLSFPAARGIRHIFVRNGFGQLRYWSRNHRVRTLKVSIGGASQTVALKDTLASQRVTLNPAVTRRIKLTVLSVYRGRDNDTCLAEISVRPNRMLGVQDAFLTLPRSAFYFGKHVDVAGIAPDVVYPFAWNAAQRAGLLRKAPGRTVHLQHRPDELEMLQRAPPGASSVTRQVRWLRAARGAHLVQLRLGAAFGNTVYRATRLFVHGARGWTDITSSALPRLGPADFLVAGGNSAALSGFRPDQGVRVVFDWPSGRPQAIAWLHFDDRGQHCQTYGSSSPPAVIPLSFDQSKQRFRTGPKVRFDRRLHPQVADCG